MAGACRCTLHPALVNDTPLTIHRSDLAQPCWFTPENYRNKIACVITKSFVMIVSFVNSEPQSLLSVTQLFIVTYRCRNEYIYNAIRQCRNRKCDWQPRVMIATMVKNVSK
ncbi:hypothetical protein K1T71_003708 [Dendrolimus kikuchii]|uniref:Uncharacterized protein n=1 Tax=Dendrolimus kikuchii TaxID=765133 RepID=A0ACC1D8L8_9NEOP|nr:hypothetical protein K1T71_003708 [Dendrolimus kikuchii]